jgi:hypothetical protein
MNSERPKTLTFGFARSSQREDEERTSRLMAGDIASIIKGMRVGSCQSTNLKGHECGA